MSRCPYTWFKSVFSATTGIDSDSPREARELRVTVRRGEVTSVDVSLPARSARWLIDLIPADVVAKIREEGIPLEAIQAELASAERLVAQPIFRLSEEARVVEVWLT